MERCFARREEGQSLVEFALVLPILMLVVVGLIEFAFMLNARNAVEFASRDGSMLAAEGGNIDGTDCVVLDRVDRDIVSPATQIRISQVTIYWSDKNGAQIGNNANVYDRSGSTTCNFGSGPSITVPYTLSQANYTYGSRCDVYAGCGGSHTGVDMVGVKVTYQHRWLTSIAQWAGQFVTFAVTTATRMEPQE